MYQLQMTLIKISFFIKYKDYVNKISQCFTVINSKEITKLNDKRYFFDRYFKFKENKRQ